MRWRALRERGAARTMAVVAATLLLLQGCASVPEPRTGPVIAGRLAVRSDAAPGRDARSASGQFELSGDPADGQLVLTSPIGTVVARARWSTPKPAASRAGTGADIVLEADGGTRRFDNFDDLTEAALGQSLPLAAMFDWLAGRPWPQAPASYEPDRGAFEQLGWRVDRSRFEANGLVVADRTQPPPALHVRVKLDRAEPPQAAASVAGEASPAPARAASAPADAH